jgi:hypothetical protein
MNLSFNTLVMENNTSIQLASILVGNSVFLYDLLLIPGMGGYLIRDLVQINLKEKP